MLQTRHNGARPADRAAAERPPVSADGLPPGTIIYTLEGALPVEVLTPGDRIITRAGARVLRELIVLPGAQGFRLLFDAPEIIYADGQELLAA